MNVRWLSAQKSIASFVLTNIYKITDFSIDILAPRTDESGLALPTIDPVVQLVLYERIVTLSLESGSAPRGVRQFSPFACIGRVGADQIGDTIVALVAIRGAELIKSLWNITYKYILGYSKRAIKQTQQMLPYLFKKKVAYHLVH